ncbi:phenylalanine 4-monooxygenase [Paludibacterium yongneupense]|uniref:phenylalanine 4-monooxygenase n=1 Tax=Paludibacterium yongneupense TaxID=400061 RepID=UPI0004294A04|nr:phenylalanine 4-monooxygenase [Paludibacterium yongneupense]
MGERETRRFWPDIHEVASPVYSDAENRTWATLLSSQRSLLPGRACREFLAGIERLDFPDDEIPRLADISDRIEACTGWRLRRVDGVVPDGEFFEMLAQRLFPSTDYIRRQEDIGYTPAPDIFHELLGHAPLLTDARFAAFFQRMGEAAVEAAARGHPARDLLPHLYWYSVEFGLIRTRDGLRIYGSGILSSPDEVLYCLSGQPTVLPFDMAAVAATPYDIWHMQETLFAIDSFAWLEEAFAEWCRAVGLE